METLTQPNPVKHAKKAMFNGEQMTSGLDLDYAEAMASKLNVLLASLQIFYANVRGYHWKVTGRQFFTLHTNFEDLYNDLAVKADEVAERILALNYKPDHNFSDFKEISRIPETDGPSEAGIIVDEIQESLSSLTRLQREMIEMAEENDDFTTSDQLTAYISEQEKLIWMYRAFRS